MILTGLTGSRKLIFITLSLFVFSACRTAKPVENESFSASTEDASAVISQIPDYEESLKTLKGKGKAIVSEPGNTERVSLDFSSNRKRSLVTVKNGIGIEGGKMLTDGDSLIVYNKIDNYVRKISVREGNLSRIDNLASLNILEIMNFTISKENVDEILENRDSYLLILKSGGKIYIDKKSFHIKQIRQPRAAQLPYSQIVYDAYSNLNGFMLPRKITIISADASSKIALLVQSLEVNSELEMLNLNIPKDATVYYQ